MHPHTKKPSFHGKNRSWHRDGKPSSHSTPFHKGPHQHGNVGGKPRFDRPRRPAGGGRGISSLDPRMFVQSAKPRAEEAPYAAKHTFSDFAFSAELAANIARKGFTKPSPIQDQTIQPGLEGRDVLGLAQTGTGKTLAFTLPLLTHLSKDPSKQALILAPTRELAQQIHDDIYFFTKGMRLFSVLTIGGVSMGKQLSLLRRKQHIIVGTPGRVLDLAQQGAIDFSQISYVVLDEVDRMLDMGFAKEVTGILDKTQAGGQHLFFSATMSPEVETLAKKYLKDPVEVRLASSKAHEYVEQRILEVTNKDEKVQAIVDVVHHEASHKVLVFCNMKHEAERVVRALKQENIHAVAIHGNKSQNQRLTALKAFTHEVDVLVATDVAARGLDIKGVTHVINYDAPMTFDEYTHRIGRTGRAGTSGFALTLVPKRG